MSQQIDAIFENGVFRPEQPVDIGSGERVSLTIERKSKSADDLSDVEDLLDREFVELCRRRAAPAPSLEDVRTILSKYQGSLSDLISQERDER